MAERVVHGKFMRPDKASIAGEWPQTRSELHAWIRETLRLPTSLESGRAKAQERAKALGMQAHLFA